MGAWEWGLGDGMRAVGGWGLVGVVELWMWAGAVAAMCAVVWVAGPVAGVLSWSSGCGATPSLVLNRESIA